MKISDYRDQTGFLFDAANCQRQACVGRAEIEEWCKRTATRLENFKALTPKRATYYDISQANQAVANAEEVLQKTLELLKNPSAMRQIELLYGCNK